MPYQFTEEDFAPKSKHDFTEEDFETNQPEAPVTSPSEDAFTKFSRAQGGPQTMAQFMPGYMKEREKIGTAEPLLTKPLVTIPHPSQETLKKFLTVPKIEGELETVVQTPEGPIAVAQRQPEIKQVAPSPKQVAVAAGVTRAGADMASFFTSPLGIATLGIGALPATVQRGIALTFAAQMAKDVPEIAKQLGTELGKPEDQRDYEKIANLTANAVANTAFVAGGVKHGLAEPIAGKLGALPSERPPITPGQLAEQSFREQPKTVTEPVIQTERIERALPDETTATVDESLLSQPGKGPEQVPAQESGKGISASEKEGKKEIETTEPSVETHQLVYPDSGTVREIGTSESLSLEYADDIKKGIAKIEPISPTIIDEDVGPGESARFTTKLPQGYATGFVKEGTAELVGIEVSKDVRRQGIGERLLRQFAEKSKQEGATTIAGDFVPGAKSLMDKVFGKPKSEKPVEDWPEGMGEPPIRAEYSITPKKTETKGILTPEQVDKMSAAELQKAMAGRGHRVGIEYGETLTEKEIPELQKKYDDTQKAMKYAARAGDLEKLQNEGAKQIFYGGALMGATKGKHPISGANYELYLKQKAAEKVSEPTPTETVLPDRPSNKGLQLKQPSTAMDQAAFINIQPLQDLFKSTSEGVKKAFNFTKEVGKEITVPEKMTDYRRSVLNWSAKLQRSFGESARIQSDIQKRVKDPMRRDAITNWIQSDGDPVVLRQQAAGSKDPKLRKGYESALNLTPDELAVANEARARYAALARRGQRYDVLDNLKDNYVTQIWDLGKGPTGGVTERTLKQKFRFSKARTFPNFFVGEQAGFVPKTKDISKLQPVYMHEMENVIAARELVEQMSQGKASDGRPLIAPKGIGIPVEKPSGDKATLVFPKAATEEFKDYKVIPNQPALEAWKWAAKDDAGNNIFLKGDLAVHPEAYNRLKNVLGKSAIREWYQTPTSRVMSIPKAIVKGIDMANAEAKKTMLGVLAPFHQVQEATHAAGHRVNPTFNIPEIDLVRNPDQMDAARHGLMLQPDRASENQFMEGFKQSKFIGKIPGIGPASNWYSNYLFHEYIPGLKYKTYQSILERNNKVYSKDLAAGRVAPEDVKILSTEQANAAFGHLNYADLGRNPTIQHFAQLGILAPDFFESRIRFTGQAVKGAAGLKVGREQLLALATLAIGQATLAYTAAKITGGEWDEKRPFEMTKDGKRYTLRSIPEDIQKFMNGPRQFLHNRLSILGKAGLQYTSGVDYRGRKVTASETTKELAQQPIPLSMRGFLGIGELSGWDQLLGAAGLKVSKASPRGDMMERARDWGINNVNPKVKSEYERREKESFPESVYKPLRQSLEDNDKNKIVQDVRELLKNEPDQAAKEKRMNQILKQFQPFTENDIKPFATRSKDNEVKFLKSLDAPGKFAYRQAIKEQIDQYRNLTAALYGKPSDPPIPAQYRKTYGQ